MAQKFGTNCSKCQRSTEQQQSIKCFKIHSKDLLQNNDFHITSIFLLSSVLVFYFFLILFFNSIVYRFFIARIFGVLTEYFRDWGAHRLVRLWGKVVSRYVKQRTGKGKTVGRSMQTEENFGREQFKSGQLNNMLFVNIILNVLARP